ncbi:MAG: hypothetical protein HFE73_10695 [Firmicutes bacterium]|nr:hypothetical protein [Bacillota bacterium]
MKKYQKISIVLLICLLCSVVTCGYAEEARMKSYEESLESVEYYGGAPVITPEDKLDDYVHYAMEGGRYTLDVPEGEKTANIVGVVMNTQRDMIINNATITVNNGELILHPGEDGRIQITNLPLGKYDFVVEAEGYYQSSYLNLKIDDETTYLNWFELSTRMEMVEDHDKIRHGCMLDVDTDEIIQNIQEYEENHVIEPMALSAAPKIKKTIKVVGKDGVVRTMERAEYLYGVVAGEAESAATYKANGLTSTQIWQYYCAQAELANTLAVYFQKVETSKHSNGDICANSGCCQNYSTANITAEIQNAVDSIFYTKSSGTKTSQVLMYKPSTSSYNYMCPFFSSSCYGKGTVTVSGIPYLKAKSCSDLMTGYGGARKGFCQNGGAKKAKNGSSCEAILTYYYTDCDTEFCEMTA